MIKMIKDKIIKGDKKKGEGVGGRRRGKKI